MRLEGTSKILVGCGGAVCTILSALGFLMQDLVVDSFSSELTSLQPGTQMWNSWMSGDKLLKFYFFNITNPDEFGRGEKLRVREVGPYIYRVKWEKVDVMANAETKSIKYKTKVSYNYESNLNDGLETDAITFVNLIYVAAASEAKRHVNDDFLMEQLDALLTSKGERLCRTDTVRNIVHQGISIKAFSDLFRNPLIKDILDEIEFQVPLVAQDGTFSLLKNPDSQEAGYMEIFSGEEDQSRMGTILSYENMAELPYWGSKCNKIAAGDGSVFPPDVQRDTVFKVFLPGTCRTFSFVYNSTELRKENMVYRFINSMDDWKSGKSNPENACYCPSPDLESDDMLCTSDGVYSLSSCTNGAPLALSLPHFYGADESISSKVEGLEPEDVKHTTSIDFQPDTGKVVEAKFRVQLNVQVRKYPSMKTFASVQDSIVPFVWTEEVTDITEAELKALASVNRMKTGLGASRIGIFAIGLALIGAGLYTTKQKRHRSPVQVVSTASENFDSEAFNYKSTFF